MYNKKIIHAWTFYDWANSVYSLVISTAIFPIYYQNLTGKNGGEVSFLGMSFKNDSLYEYTLSLSFLIVVFLSPILSGIADYSGNKKKFLNFFCTMGSIATVGLFFFENLATLWVGLLGSLFASIGFWGSLVFYNAYLLEIAPKKDHDIVSAKGYVLGYVGSVILLLICLILQMFPHWFAIENPTLPARIGFVLVGLWWWGFSRYTLYYLPSSKKQKSFSRRTFIKGFQELSKVYREIKTKRKILCFQTAFFCYSTGVQTVILIASLYASKVLGLETTQLILTILIIQLVAVLGAYFFARLSKKIGNIATLKITVFCWGVICVSAFFLQKNNPQIALQFYILAGFLGFVLGAIQSISRSTYSKMIPASADTATYFSFYGVVEKIAIVLGTFLSGLTTSLTGSMRYAILVLGLFFLVGYVFLYRMKRYADGLQQ